MASKNSYDVIFIGSGHSCWHGAVLLKMAGKSVALVERELLGGTCTNYGCNAKILLDSPIELKEALGLPQQEELHPVGAQNIPQDVPQIHQDHIDFTPAFRKSELYPKNTTIFQ